MNYKNNIKIINKIINKFKLELNKLTHKKKKRFYILKKLNYK